MKYKKILLLLDYDGTLTPIVKTPNEAKMSPAVRKIIQRLSRKINVGIITGRALADIQKKIRIKNIIYAANHGLEIKLPGEKLWVQPEAKKVRRLLPQILPEVKKNFAGIPGIYLEDKKYSLGIHYRKTRIRRKEIIQRLKIVEQMFKYKKLPEWKIIYGKKVAEICPKVNWDKGSVVKKLRRTYQPNRVIYIGDDQTDENAFAVLIRRDIGIVVGRKKCTFAGYFLKNHSAVKQFLKKLDKTL